MAATAAGKHGQGVGPAVAARVNPPPDIDPRSPANQKVIEEFLARQSEAEDWVRGHLKQNGLRPDPINDKGTTVLYNNKSTNLDDVITETVSAGQKAPIKDPTLVTEEMARKIAAEVLIAASPGGASMSPANTQVQLTMTFIPTTHHTPLRGGPGSNDQPALQLECDIVVAIHAQHKSGLEFTGKANATLFADPGTKTIKVQNVSGGLQTAWVFALLNDNIEISPQLAVSFGGSRAQLDGGDTTFKWTPTGQVSGSGQALFKAGTVLKTDIWIGVQAGIGVNAPAGAAATLDSSGGLVIVFQLP